MIKLLFTLLLGSLLGSCTSIPPLKSHREILQSTIAMTGRLDHLAVKLRRAGASLCGEHVGDSGVILHKISDYPELYQPVAKSMWALDREKVLYVRPESKAQQSGLVFGDMVTSENIMSFRQMDTGCDYEVRVRIDSRANAFANGEKIFVTTGLMENIDDLPLSLVIAHELAHNVLGHVAMEISTKNEREADRWAVFLLARAGLDYEQAVADPVSWYRHTNKGDDKRKGAARARHFETVISEVKRLQAQGLPLIP